MKFTISEMIYILVILISYFHIRIRFRRSLFLQISKLHFVLISSSPTRYVAPVNFNTALTLLGERTRKGRFAVEKKVTQNLRYEKKHLIAYLLVEQSQNLN
jgi:hypothetical protein